MVEQILLSSVSFDGVRERGGFGQPLHTLYPQIRAVLASELGSDTADLLAEPVVDRVHNRIDWYTAGDPEQPPVALSTLPEEQRQPILDQVNNLLERGREMAGRYTSSGDIQRIQLGAILKAVLSPLAEDDVFLVNGRPVVVHWGFAPDRPWVTSGVSVRGAFATPDPPSGLPDITIPQWEVEDLQSTTTHQSITPPESVTESAKPDQPPESPPDLPPEQPASTEPPAALLIKPTPRRQREAAAEVATPETPPITTNADGGLRYVVVGSRYFWGVVILALLLALGALFWSMTHRSTPLLTGAAQDGALTDARHIEQELRLQLEQRRTALLEQHRQQCVPPDSTAPVPVPTAPTPPPTPVLPDTSSPPSAVSTSSPTPSSETAELSHSDPAVTASSPPSPLESTGQEATVQPDTPTTAPHAQGEPSGLTLEGALRDAPAPVTPPEPVNESPVQAEATPAERQEFTDRLSATGATTGEITATLLWDGNADLDLIVRCPSGQTLDYLTPQGCGGTLDVDANAARESLSEKPVENVFWAAHQAKPGVYKVAVRYEPRKDERNPQPIPFQVRLIRDNKEKVFKGTIRPRKTLQIANFTVVER